MPSAQPACVTQDADGEGLGLRCGYRYDSSLWMTNSG
jgi:hypothetical protein